MTDSIRKPHKEWRKDVKKLRRKRIRQKLAIVRKEKEKERENSPTYLLELEKKRLYEEFILEKEAKENEERHKKWLEEEERNQKKWREEERLKQLALKEKLEEQEKLRNEWEKEQKKIREQKERLEVLKKEEERRQRETLERINDFIYNGGDLPAELRLVTESNPGTELCTFHQKMGACRFGNQCSRNHQYYQISNVLLFSNFYSHFTLDQSKASEYDTDISLEFEDSDMYLHFKEFYNDIVPEFKKFGEVTMVKVCCNTEFHLRGNVYVEYENEREAVAAYQKFQGRWYGGRQLQIEFVKIKDWGSAVCGDFARQRCPKGKSCNFLHVFRNPKNEFSIEWNKKKHDDYDRLRSRNWRWSESPGPSINKIRESVPETLLNGHKRSRNLVKKRKSRSSERRTRKSKSPEKRKTKSRSSERRTRKSKSPEKRKTKSRSPERRTRKSKSPEKRKTKSRSPERRTKKSRNPESKKRKFKTFKQRRSRSCERRRIRSNSPLKKSSHKRRKADSTDAENVVEKFTNSKEREILRN